MRADSAVNHAGSDLTLAEHTFSSMVASVPVSFVACPTELIKCRLQHQGTYASALQRVQAWEAGGKKGPAPTLYRGPVDVLKQVYKNEAGVKGLSNGLGATLIREIPGNALMFGTCAFHFACCCVLTATLRPCLAKSMTLPSTDACAMRVAATTRCQVKVRAAFSCG